jgi:hypothetical protein
MRLRVLGLIVQSLSEKKGRESITILPPTP